MLKKQSGITLTVLIITVVVLLILASVIMSINMRLNKTVDLKEIQANMETIKIVASEYRTKYLDDETEDISGNIQISNKFVGKHCTSSNSSGEIISALLEYRENIGKLSNYWFQLDSSNIDALGTGIKLKDDELYFINYETLDIAYCKKTTETGVDGKKCYQGVKTKKGEYNYFYSDIKNLKTDEVSN